MPPENTVVDHLLLGRQALTDDIEGAHAEMERLQAEVERLAGAIDQLDAVIAVVGAGQTPPPVARTAPPARAQVPAAAPPATAPVRSSAPVKKAATRARKQPGQAPKSIRVHVLDMLAAEDRDWSLAEIIDRIHDAGIQAHDDAVRSITIKLMKDGRVERVGRGQYRLTRRGGASRHSATSVTPPPAAAASTPPESDPVVDPSPEDTTAEGVATEPETVTAEQPELATSETDEPAGETLDGETPSDEPAASESSDSTRSYTPPLNLGQPWG